MLNSDVILEKLGQQLDNNIFPRIKNGGFVMPTKGAVSLLTMGEDKRKEKNNEQHRKRRSTTESWSGAAARKRPSNRSGSSSKAAPFICPDIQANNESLLDEVCNAYPNTRIWHQAGGLWLLSESNLLPGLWQKAVFLTGIPFVSTLSVRSWGFWLGGLYKGPTWIGPRHTNYPDGSICAFEPKDGTWNVGDSIVSLLDLYTLWAVRHLYLQRFGRWPGRQVAHYAYERIIEFNKDEYCGCENSDKLYKNCCQQKDLEGDRRSYAKEFRLRVGFKERRPPTGVVRFINDQTEPPLIRDLFAA